MKPEDLADALHLEINPENTAVVEAFDSIGVIIGKTPCCVCKLPLTRKFVWATPSLPFSRGMSFDFFCHEGCFEKLDTEYLTLHGERN